MSSKLPGVADTYSLPFYYSALKDIGVFYQVPVENVTGFLDDTGLEPAVIEEKAVVSFNFQSHFEYFTSGCDQDPDSWKPFSGFATRELGNPDSWKPFSGFATQELELNILAAPKTRIDQACNVTFRQFILGDEQSKILGNHRVWVPCDVEDAVKGGTALFGERKFQTAFKVNLPTRNAVRVTKAPEFTPVWPQTYGFRVMHPPEKTDNKKPDLRHEFIFTCTIDVTGLTPFPGNFSPITEYGVYDDEMIASRWNILQPMDSFFLDESDAERVKLTFGKSPHKMNTDMQKLIGNAPASAVRTFESPIAAVQSRCFLP